MAILPRLNEQKLLTSMILHFHKSPYCVVHCSDFWGFTSRVLFYWWDVFFWLKDIESNLFPHTYESGEGGCYGECSLLFHQNFLRGCLSKVTFTLKVEAAMLMKLIFSKILWSGLAFWDLLSSHFLIKVTFCDGHSFGTVSSLSYAQLSNLDRVHNTTWNLTH